MADLNPAFYLVQEICTVVQEKTCARKHDTRSRNMQVSGARFSSECHP